MSFARLRWVAPCVLTLGAAPVLAIALICAVVVGIEPHDAQGSSNRDPQAGRLAVPARWAQAEVHAALGCPGLSWSVLGALGWLASRSGGDHPGTAPPWWAWDGGVFGIVRGDGGRSQTNLRAAQRATATICAAQAASGSLAAGLGNLTGSSSWALEIEVVAVGLRDAPTLLDQEATAIDFAVHALGLPYAWGGNGPRAYDCSGLIVAAERAAGRTVPRTAQAQHDASRRVTPPGLPGDLAFFGGGPGDIGHVGLIIGGGLMIDAPHTGAVVRIESYAWDELVDEGSPTG